ncbi:hypothetical protein Tco_0434756 [Tanacetum coccineum]
MVHNTHPISFTWIRYLQISYSTSSQEYLLNVWLDPGERVPPFPFLEFLHKTPLSKSSVVDIRVQGSCNGLISLLQDDGQLVTSLAVVHPLRKEGYELPPLSMRFDKTMLRDSCGLVGRGSYAQWGACLGTNYAGKYPKSRLYPITAKAVFVKGYLHWLVSDLDVQTDDGGRPVIWFDVEKEEFGPIDPPKRMCDIWRKYSCKVKRPFGSFGWGRCHLGRGVGDGDGIQGGWKWDGRVFGGSLLKEWVPHCRFKEEIVPDGYIDVMGCWNKDGDILIKINSNGSYASGVLHKTNIARTDDALSPKFIMYPNKLSSIHVTLSIVILSTPTVPDGYIYVIGCWNKDGLCTEFEQGLNEFDRVMHFSDNNLKSGVLQKTNIAGLNDAWSPNFIMYPNTLSSILATQSTQLLPA